jgi:hypothetical protein
VEPTKRKPRFRSSRLIASDCPLVAGTSPGAAGRFTSGAPPTKDQRKRSRLPSRAITPSAVAALSRTDRIFARLRIRPGSASRAVSSASVIAATRAMSNPWNARR